jgi:hypothetical protein
MNAKQILFNPAMVKAILEGRKTNTRRPVNPQPDEDGLSLYLPSGEWNDTSGKVYKSPFVKVGDLLWVRERMYVDGCLDLYFHADNSPVWNDSPDWLYRDPEYIGGIPSIHMPRWASRLTLKVNKVWVEQVQDITGPGVFAEGVDNGKSNPAMGARLAHMQRMAFQELWNTIYGEKYPWSVNPWVWACEFEVIMANVDKILIR